MTIIRILATALLCALLPPVTPAAPAHESAAAILARLRAATLSRPLSSIASIHTAGTFEAIGLHGRVNEWDDLAGARFAQRTTGSGPISGANGWNGSVAWVQEASGIVRIDGGESGRLQAIDQAYMDTYAYLRPHAGGAAATFVGERHEGEAAYDIVQLTPPGGSTFQIWIDRRTHVIAKSIGTIGLVASTTTYSDYQRLHGITIALAYAFRSSNGNGGSGRIDAVSINEPSIAARIRVPRSNARGFSISGGTSTTVPIHVINNHIYLHVMLDGKGPYNFIFDTGGAYIVTPEVAAALHARNTGGVHVQGIGAQTESAQFTRVAALRIGNATIHNQDFLVLPIARGFGIAEGVKIDGMIGYDIPARFLTTIDYAAGTMTLSPAGSRKPVGAALPFFFDGTIPRVPVTLDGVTASAQLDTGNRDALALFSPFVAAHPKLAAEATTANGVIGFGVGGPALGRLGRVNLRIGPFRLDRVVAAFSTQHTGATADPFTPANVGGGLWKRFSLTLDYPHQRIYLKPNARYDKPFSYDRSGLFIIDYNGEVVVLDARAGTPAAAAGMKKRDIILAVNGKPATSYTLAHLRALLSGVPGTMLHLYIRSGTAERDVNLRLEDYV